MSRAPLRPSSAAAPRAPAAATASAQAAPDADSAIERHRDALRERFPLPAHALAPPRPAARRRTAAAGAALACVAAALLLWWDPAWRTERIATGPRQRLEVTLQDGSHATLDVATRLTVSRHLRSRQVALQAGRALFDVQPSAWRPFTVQAGATTVRVLGTAFDVRRQDDEVTVTVLRGRVAVAGAGGPGATLGPDEQVRSHAGNLQPAATFPGTDAAAWREGRMVFHRTPLAEVLAEVARYSGRPVRLADPSLAALEVSGVYRTDQADALLALLPGVLPVRIEPGPGAERRVLRQERP